MHFGIFSVGDVTPDPTNGRTPSEGERISAMVAIALKAEEVGLDVFATGEHHNPPFVPSSPTTMLGYIAARTEKLILSTATTLITTNDPVKIAEDYAMLQHLADGWVDLMMGRGNTGPVYPWFGQDIPQGVNLAKENYALLRRLWGGGCRRLGGHVPHAPAGVHVHTPAARRRAPVRIARLHPLTGDRRAGGLLRRRLLPQQHLLARRPHQADGPALPAAVRLPRPRPAQRGRRGARRAGVHTEELAGRGTEVPPLLRQRARLRTRAVAGGVHRADSADRGFAAAGHRADTVVPRDRRRLPAAVVPDGPRGAAPEDGPGTARHPRRRGGARAARGVRGRPAGVPDAPTHASLRAVQEVPAA